MLKCLGYCIKQIDSILTWVCTLITHRGRQNVVRTSVTLLAILLCSHHVLTSSVHYQSTDARQNGIYLLIIPCLRNNSLYIFMNVMTFNFLQYTCLCLESTCCHFLRVPFLSSNQSFIFFKIKRMSIKMAGFETVPSDHQAVILINH